ncbi:MAG: hypothetical protein PWP10_3408 [Clostridiales bacterium]|nr:hypothetical protein [Clostridiales bacterium]
MIFETENERIYYDMITIFNRRELIFTSSMEEQARVCHILAAKGIDYNIKSINRYSPSAFSGTQASTGTFGENMEYAYEYKVYVHKNDLDEAVAYISGKIK